MRALKTRRHRSAGFTLVELVMVIVIMGVIGGIVAVFMRGPIDAYFDSGRRAALTDVADTAVRRMARDIRKALPNSLRLPLAGLPSLCIEFIPTKIGGRYRAEVDAAGNGDILNFSAVDASFDMLGANSALVDQAIAQNDLIAVYNLGIAGADAYNAANTSAVTLVGAGDLPNETKITITPRQFPLASGSNRFHVIPVAEPAVSYVCTGVGTNAAGEGTGTLFRLVRALAANPAACPVPPASTPVLAQNVSTCSFVYDGSSLQRNAVVQVTLGMTRNAETVNLYHEVHVDNTP